MTVSRHAGLPVCETAATVAVAAVDVSDNDDDGDNDYSAVAATFTVVVVIADAAVSSLESCFFNSRPRSWAGR